MISFPHSSSPMTTWNRTQGGAGQSLAVMPSGWQNSSPCFAEPQDTVELCGGGDLEFAVEGPARKSWRPGNFQPVEPQFPSYPSSSGSGDLEFAVEGPARKSWRPNWIQLRALEQHACPPQGQWGEQRLAVM